MQNRIEIITFYYINNLLIIKLRIESNIEPNKAARKSVTMNPGTSFDTSQNKRALIIKVNKPKVSKLIGRVNKINTGFIKTFTSPITIAAHKAAPNPAKLIPGTAHATKSNAPAKSTHLKSKNNIFLSP